MIKENVMAIDRRDFLKLMGLGSAILVLGPHGQADAAGAKAAKDDFFFVQLSDTHWGFSDPKINADYQGTLEALLVRSTSFGIVALGQVQPREVVHRPGDAILMPQLCLQSERLLEMSVR